MHTTTQVDAVVVGGGPAGLMAGLVLARAGLRVEVLEKHGDFLRDFRGDTVHPSTLTLLDELGLGEEFAALRAHHLSSVELRPAGGGDPVTVVDVSRLRVPHPYIAMVPQWDFLDILASAAQEEEGFTLRMRADAMGLEREGDKVTGVRWRDADGAEHTTLATVTLLCDGRGSTLREEAGLVPVQAEVPFDVWWVRVPGAAEVPDRLIPWQGDGLLYVLIPRGDYVQMAILYRRGTEDTILAGGVDGLRERLTADLPQLATGLATLREEDLKPLRVELSRLPRWWVPGLICLGDAAHTMSPVGGVGVNLAVQDGVAAGSVLAGPLLDGSLSNAHARQLQRRREPSARIVQGVQRAMHAGLQRVLDKGLTLGPPPRAADALRRLPGLAAVPAWLMAIGPRPEHAPDFARR